MPLPFLAFLAPALGLAASLAGTAFGQPAAAHYIGQIAQLLLKGTRSALDIDADLKELLAEMQQLVSEQRAATPEEMAASNTRLKESVQAALEHDVSTHPSIRDVGAAPSPAPTPPPVPAVTPVATPAPPAPEPGIVSPS